MLSVKQLREDIGADCTKVLSHIWSLFLVRKEWPASRLVHSALTKEFVTSALSRTNGSVVFECNSGGLSVYQLAGVAPLLTEHGPTYEALLIRYLEFLRELYRRCPEQRSVSNEEVAEALGLSPEEGATLGHLIMIGRLFSNSASHGNDKWTVGVFNESEDFPDASLAPTLETLLLRSYNPSYPVFYPDQVASLSQPNSPQTATAMSHESSPPNVFISYSHESSEHKQWVMDLAQKLRNGGIAVVLDEWKLRLGSDVLKFMEEAVAAADRVLMICTERYVDKVDSREGGVGYEATMVMGELIESLGTSKFIPVIRQKSKRPKIPRAMKGRLYVNLSHGGNYDEEFEKLLRDLHGAPRSIEPVIGHNPFASTAGATDESVKGPLDQNPVARFHEARQLIQADDYLGWRSLGSRLKREANERLGKLRDSLGAKLAETGENQAEYLGYWCDNYQEVMVVSLAGLLSGKPRFKDQVSVIDELLHPPHWHGTGHSVITRLPEITVFLFQSLHGAVCLEMGQTDLAMSLAFTRYKLPSENEPERVFLIHSFVGWFEGRCHSPWLLLSQLPKRWPWLHDVFGSEENYLASICAYYSMLNLAELAYAISKNIEFHSGDYNFDVPLGYNMVERRIIDRAYRMLSQPGRSVSEAWRTFDVTFDQMKSHWEAWKEQCYKWLASVYGHGVRKEQLIHYRLFEDLRG